MGKEQFVKALDEYSQKVLVEEPRQHLGPSSVGGLCARQIFYGFRWAHRVTHGGRMLRLFNRGHEEEHRVVRWLRATGVKVRDYAERLMYHSGSDFYTTTPWDDEEDHVWAECDDVSEDRWHIERATAMGQGPKQWGFVDGMGEGQAISIREGAAYVETQHFKGSGDGQVFGLEPWFPEVEGHGWGLFENKTHNDKSFVNLVKKGVISAKPEHYNQMQIYMHYMGLKWGLYTGVNKNTDDIYPEIVWYKPEVAEFLINRARGIIATREAPPRYTDDPSWFICRFCDFREICHYDKEMQTSCRSCAYASAEPDGTWYCNFYQSVIPTQHLQAGCDYWEQVR